MPQPPDIRMVDILRDLWAARMSMLMGLVVGIVAASVFVLIAVPHFKARMIVAPANTMDGAEMSSLMANDDLFALRYLIQRMGTTSSSDFMSFENIYAGPSVAGALLEDDAVLKGLGADEGFVFSQAQTEWNAARLSAYLSRRVTLEPLGGGGLRVLTYSHPDPAFAAVLLQKIHAQADLLIREKIRKQAAERIAYLNNAISKTLNPEHRRTLTTLLLEQERLLMLVSIDQPFAASIVEPPAASAKPVWPDALLLLSVLGLVGAFLGFVIDSLRHTPSTYTAASYGGGRRLNRWYKDEPINSDHRGAPANRATE